MDTFVFSSPPHDASLLSKLNLRYSLYQVRDENLEVELRAAILQKILQQQAASLLGKTHINKVFFLVVEPLMFYPPYTNGLVSMPLFFSFFFLVFFFPIFGLKQPDFRKKSVFLLSGPTPLVVRPLKKTYLCVFFLRSKT